MRSRWRCSSPAGRRTPPLTAFGLRLDAAFPRRALPARFLRTNMVSRSTPSPPPLRAKFAVKLAGSGDFRRYHRLVLSEVDQVGGRVLVVEDDVDIADVLRRSLRNEGYEVRTSADGVEALDVAAGFVPDLVVLDLGLPGLDGIEVCRRLRSDGDVPILMLTARAETEDRVTGLDSGADDYLVKPFEREELLARIRALLRRRPPRGSAFLVVGDLRLNPDTREVSRGDRKLELTAREFELLEHLMRNARIVVSRQALLDEVWGYHPFAETNTVDVFISNVRRKLEAGGEPRILHTMRGAGYVLRDP